LRMASAFLKLEKLSRGGGAFRVGQWNRRYSKLSYRAASESEKMEEEEVPSSGISRPLSEILKELNKKVPDSVVKTRLEKDGFPIRYIPWFLLFPNPNPNLCFLRFIPISIHFIAFFSRHIVNRILNLHAPGII